MSFFDSLPFNFSLTGFSTGTFIVQALPYILGFLFLVFIVVGAILDYHWRSYGVGLIRLFQFRFMYVAAGLVFLAAMFISYSSL